MTLHESYSALQWTRFCLVFFFQFLGIQLSTEPELMLDQAQNKWQVILKHYAGVVAVAAIGLLLAAIIPIAGVFVCCCRCAGILSITLYYSLSYLSPVDRSLLYCLGAILSLQICTPRERERRLSIHSGTNFTERWKLAQSMFLFKIKLIVKDCFTPFPPLWWYEIRFFTDRSRQMLPGIFWIKNALAIKKKEERRSLSATNDQIKCARYYTAYVVGGMLIRPHTLLFSPETSFSYPRRLML